MREVIQVGEAHPFRETKAGDRGVSYAPHTLTSRIEAAKPEVPTAADLPSALSDRWLPAERSAARMSSAMDQYELFTQKCRELVEDRSQFEEAATLANRYWSEPFTGRFFHILADDDRPDEITELDITAVSMLGVTIPPKVAIWLLDEGRPEVSELLHAIPTDVDIWDAGDLITPNGELRELWSLLRTGSWPTPGRGNGMGPTKTSKLLAAKRPRLVPVYDSVLNALFPKVDSYWTAFERALSDDKLRALFSVASMGGAPEGATFLRRLDAMLWMIGGARQAVSGTGVQT